MRRKNLPAGIVALLLLISFSLPAQESIPDEEFPLDNDIEAKPIPKTYVSPEVAKLNRENLADAYPFLSADGLRLYYSSAFNTSFSNLYISERKSITEPFTTSRQLCPGYEEGYYAATFTADELTMYLGRSGKIYVARRTNMQSPFGKPELVEGLPGGFIFAPAISPGGEELVLVKDSNPDRVELFKMTAYNKAVPSLELKTPETGYREPGTGQFSKDGLQFYLSVYNNMNQSVILRGTRASLNEDFSGWEELKLGTAGSSVAGQPTVNGDGTILMFISSPQNTWSGDDLVYTTDFNRETFARNANRALADKVIPEAPVMVQAKLYPNPATSSVTFELQQEPTADYTLWLSDMNGRRLKQQRINARRTIIDVAGLQSGMYVYEVRDDAGKLVFTGKLVKGR